MIAYITYKDTEEYSLVSESQGRVIIPEPINFEDGNRNIYERDEESKGFLTARSNELEFYGDATSFLQRQVSTKGVAEDVRLEKRMKSDDRADERWRDTVPVYLDIAALQITERKGAEDSSKTKSTDGGLKKLIDSRKSDQFDLTSLFDIGGNAINALSTETVQLDSREIFLRSTMKTTEGFEITATVSGGDRLNARAVPFEVDINSDRDNIDSVLGTRLNAASNDFASLEAANIGNCWLTQSDNDKILTLNGRIELSIMVANSSTGPNRLSIVIYDSDFNVKNQIELTTFNPGNVGEIIAYDFNDYDLQVQRGDSVTFGLLSDTSDGIRYRVAGTEIEIAEDSLFLPNDAKCLTYKQVINRLLYIITGVDDLVVSDLLTTGELSEDIVLNGFWARGFPDIVNEGTDEERKTQFIVSLEQILAHIEALLPKAWWIEQIGNQEFLRLEPVSYTQQNFTGVPFGQKNTNGSIIYFEASNIKRKYLKKNFFSKLEFGSEKGGDDYEEVFGLTSINGKALYNTINSNQDSTYSKLSPFRMGDVDVELARRKSYTLYPEEDTRYDSDIMCIRTKRTGSKYYIKKWPDVMTQAPTNIYRPDSAYNLDITPGYLLRKHGANINSALYHYPNENIIFASSNCNSSFQSQLIGGVLFKEDQPIPHSQLDRPRIMPIQVELTLQVTQEIEDYMTGVNDDGVPNWFGLVKINTGNGIEDFRLKKSDLNKEGKHELIQAYI